MKDLILEGSKNLFQTVALRGGAVEPKNLIDAYVNANRALFNSQKLMVQDLNAAEILKGDMKEIGSYVSGKVGKKNYNALKRALFVPYIPSKNIFRKSREITKEIQEVDPTYRDPLRDILPTIANIRRQLFRLDLNEEFPIIENPLDVTLGTQILDTIQAPLIELGFLGQNNIANMANTGMPYDQLKTTDQKIDRINKVDSIIKG